MATLSKHAGILTDILRSYRASPEAIARRQRERLDDLVAFARAHSPFYRDHYQAVGPFEGDLRRLPPVRKPRLMADFDRWVTDPDVTLAKAREFAGDPARIGSLFLGRYLLCTTSGTTGEPAILLHDATERFVFSLVSALRGYQTFLDFPRRLGIFRDGFRPALFAVDGGHYSGVATFRANFKGRQKGRGLFVSVVEPIDKQVAQLNAFKPTVMVGYSSSVWLMAHEARAGRLAIKPRLIVTVGENLSEFARRDLEDTFQCPVRETYASSECLGIASQCSAGRLHVNADWVIVEAVDRNYQPVAPGELSHTTLITNLANRIQPFIRYDLGDGIIYDADPCPCGRKLPTFRVSGRSGDVLRLPAANGGADVLVSPLVFETVVEETPGVHRFQVIQTDKGKIAVKLIPEENSQREDVWRLLTARMDEYGRSVGAGPLTYELLPDAPRADPKSGKFRHVVCWKPRP